METQNKRHEASRLSADGVLVLLLTAALPLAFASGFSAYDVLKEALLAVGGGALLVIWAVNALRGRASAQRGALVALPLVVLGALALLSALWSQSGLKAIASAGHWFALLGILLTLQRSPVKFEDLCVALAVGAGGAATVGLLQSFGVVLDPRAPGLLTDGLRATFDFERSAALSLGCALPLLAMGLVSATSAVRKGLIGLGLVLSAFFVGVANATLVYGVVLAGFLLAFGVVAVASSGTRAWLGRGLAAIGVVVVAGAAGELAASTDSFENSVDRVNEVSKLVGVDVARTNLVIAAADWGRGEQPATMDAQRFAWSAGTEMLSANPITGVGSGHFDVTAMSYLDVSQPWYHSNFDAYPMFRSAHNSFLQAGGELGVLGLLMVIALLALSVAGVWVGLKGDEPVVGGRLSSVQLAGLLGVIVAVSVGALFESLLHQPFTGLLLVVCLGVLMADVAARGGAGFLKGQVLGASGGRAVPAAGLALAAALLVFVASGAVTASDYYKAKGDVWIKAGDAKRGGDAYTAALGWFPANDLARFNLAHIEASLKTRPEAEVALLEALKLRPVDPRVYDSLGDVQVRLAMALAQERQRKAQEDPKAFEEVKNNDPQSLFKEFDEKVMANAEANLKSAITLHPHGIKSYETLANLYVSKKDREEAIVVLLKALDEVAAHSSKQAAGLHTKVAFMYAYNEKWPMARKHLEKALELYPANPQRRSLIAEINRVQDRIEGRVEPEHNHDHGGGLGSSPIPGMPPSFPGKAGQPGKSLEKHGDKHRGHGDTHKGHKNKTAPAEGGAKPPAPKPGHRH